MNAGEERYKYILHAHCLKPSYHLTVRLARMGVSFSQSGTPISLMGLAMSRRRSSMAHERGSHPVIAGISPGEAHTDQG
jgi:hypothetical protein